MQFNAAVHTRSSRRRPKASGGHDIYGRRAFSVADQTAWNSFLDFIRDPTSSTGCLGVYSKRSCSRDTGASSALAGINDYALYKSELSMGLVDPWVGLDPL